MSNHHHAFSKRLESNQQVDVADTYVSGGFICDLSVKINALKLPLNANICYTKSEVKPHKQLTPVIGKNLRKCVRRFMRGLSKQELSNYIVQLLLDCPHENPLSESIQCCCLRGCTLHCSPDATPNSHPRSHYLPSEQNRPSSDDRRNKPSNHQHKDVRENVDGSNIINQNQSRATQDQSFFNDIISAIDLLCDMRDLFLETLQESREKNMSEAPLIENKIVRSTDKKSRPRLANDERFQECVATKRNKKVQTEAYHNKRNENIYNLQSQEYNREHESSSRGLEDQANSYDRFINNFRHHQTPSPLIPPRANLQPY